MEKRTPRLQVGETHPPTSRDRVIVLLMSLGFFVFLLAVPWDTHAPLVVWIVVIIVIGVPVITINLLLPFSRWENRITTEGLPTTDTPKGVVSGDKAGRDRWVFPLPARSMGRRRFKTADGTSFRCEQHDGRFLLNGHPLTGIRLLNNGIIHLQTEDQQFLVDGATYWGIVFGDETPTPMQVGLLLARLDELMDLLQSLTREKHESPDPPHPA